MRLAFHAWSPAARPWRVRRGAAAAALRQRTRFVRGRPPRAHAGANSTLTAEHELGNHIVHVQSAGRWQESAAEPMDWRQASVLAASRQAFDAAGGNRAPRTRVEAYSRRPAGSTSVMVRRPAAVGL